MKFESPVEAIANLEVRPLPARNIEGKMFNDGFRSLFVTKRGGLYSNYTYHPYRQWTERPLSLDLYSLKWARLFYVAGLITEAECNAHIDACDAAQDANEVTNAADKITRYAKRIPGFKLT